MEGGNSWLHALCWAEERAESQVDPVKVELSPFPWTGLELNRMNWRGGEVGDT